ncbi:MAG: aminodeoxychorismate/anthranilate synthase component II [Candidatus Omnitrophica bacterium]|nr:aminodeoxychorismate/anthranilate synthase component II [Candidatus Omnitrophota bacterium]
MILVIDNYDSFTYNLVQYLAELGGEIKVFRNDKISFAQIEKLYPSHIVISPGPGRPEDAGISKGVISEFSGRIPILGVCLGHQAIAEVCGAKIVQAKNLMHGKVSLIYHNKKHIFKNIPSPFKATRYHSLIVNPVTVPDALEVIARTKDKEIMAVRHKKYPVFGVQFHPESILTEVGHDILKNFLKY